MQIKSLVQKKPFKNWRVNVSSNAIMEEISVESGIPAARLLIPIITSKKNLTIIRGTYAHPDLIPHIASWASPSFAVRVSKIINRYFIKKAIKAKEKIIKKKDDKIDELSNKIDELLHNNDTLLSKNKKMDNRIKRLLKKNDEIYEINEDISSKIDVISNDRVVSTGRERDEHMLVIIKNNDDPEEYDEADILYEYHTLRVMKKSYRQRLISHMERHPDMVIIKKIYYSPNSMNLWTRIKKKLGSGRKRKIEIDNCKFNLVKDYTEDDLIRDIMKIHDERLKYDTMD